MKKIGLFSIVLALSFMPSLTAQTEQDSGNKVDLKSYDTVCFDAHGCVLDKDWPNRIKCALANAPRLFFVFLPKTITWALKYRKKYAIEWMHLRSDMTCDPRDLSILNADKPNVDMMNYIRDLKSKGVKTCLCSNLGVNSIGHYVERYPEYFGESGLFDSYALSGFAGTKEDLPNALGKLRGMNKDQLNYYYINKKNPEAYKRYKDMLSRNINIEYPNILLIDDSLKKLDVSDKEGFKGYHFKNLGQLLKDSK